MTNSGPGDKTPDAERRITSPAKSNTFIEITASSTSSSYNNYNDNNNDGSTSSSLAAAVGHAAAEAQFIHSTHHYLGGC